MMSHKDEKKDLEIENEELKGELQQTKEVLKQHSQQIDSLKTIVLKMEQLTNAMLELRPPSWIYALFL